MQTILMLQYYLVSKLIFCIEPPAIWPIVVIKHSFCVQWRNCILGSSPDPDDGPPPPTLCPVRIVITT